MKKLLSLAFAFVILACFPIIAAADTVIPWSDTTIYWPSWGTAGENGQDVIGSPQISGGTIVVSDAGYLKAVTFNFANWNVVKMQPGDLFLDLIPGGSSDFGWDYFMSLYWGRSQGDLVNQFSPVVAMNAVPLYAVTGNESYLVTPNSDPVTGYFANYDIRNMHPYAYTGGGVPVPLGYGTVTGGYNSSPLTFNLPAEAEVQYNGYIRFGFSENCANDVVLETINIIPEPSTIMLLGIGMGLIVASRFSRKK